MAIYRVGHFETRFRNGQAVLKPMEVAKQPGTLYIFYSTTASMYCPCQGIIWPICKVQIISIMHRNFSHLKIFSLQTDILCCSVNSFDIKLENTSSMELSLLKGYHICDLARRGGEGSASTIEPSFIYEQGWYNYN